MAYRIVNGVLEADTASEIIELHKLLSKTAAYTLPYTASKERTLAEYKAAAAQPEPEPAAETQETATAQSDAPKRAKRPSLAVKHGVRIGQLWQRHLGRGKRVIRITSLLKDTFISEVVESDSERPYIKPMRYTSLIENYKLIADGEKLVPAGLSVKIGQVYQSKGQKYERTIQIKSVKDGVVVPKILKTNSPKPTAKRISVSMIQKRYRLIKDI